MILDYNTALLLFKKELKYDITEEDLDAIIKLYFNFIKDEIESGNLEQIRLKYFGSFKPMFGKIKHLEKHINWEKFNEKEKERYVKLFNRFKEISENDTREPEGDD